MGGTPVIVTVRAGVQFTPAAAASFVRAESDWNRKTGRARIDVNSTFRDPVVQLRMYQAWEAWVQGRGPKPNHSRALHPDESVHCDGEALDSDDWTLPGFVAHMADHGWIRTAANDPTEQHHFEYQWWRDTHRADPAPAATGDTDLEEDEMRTPRLIRRGDKAGAQVNILDEYGARQVLALKDPGVGDGELLDALQRVYGPIDTLTEREFDIVSAAANNRWGQARQSIVDGLARR